MRKLLSRTLLFVSVILISSCSSSAGGDDNPTVSSITVTVNGNTIVFNSVTVNRTTDGGVLGGPTLEITGIVGTSTDRVITIILDEGATGANSLDSFVYVDTPGGINVNFVPFFGTGGGVSCGNGTLGDDVGNFVTSANNATNASGNFSLTAQDCVNGSIVTTTFTSGSFSVTH